MKKNIQKNIFKIYNASLKQNINFFEFIISKHLFANFHPLKTTPHKKKRSKNKKITMLNPCIYYFLYNHLFLFISCANFITYRFTRKKISIKKIARKTEN